MAVVPNPDRDHYNGIVAAGDGCVTSFIPRGHSADSWHFVGIQVVKASVFASLPDNVPAETVSGIYRERVQRGGGRVFVFPVDAPFFDIGTPRDYMTAAHALVPADECVSPGAEVSSQARLTGTLVWPGSAVGQGATLDGCVVAGAHVPPGFQASGALLLPAGAARAGDTRGCDRRHRGVPDKLAVVNESALSGPVQTYLNKNGVVDARVMALTGDASDRRYYRVIPRRRSRSSLPSTRRRSMWPRCRS